MQLPVDCGETENKSASSFFLYTTTHKQWCRNTWLSEHWTTCWYAIWLETIVDCCQVWLLLQNLALTQRNINEYQTYLYHNVSYNLTYSIASVLLTVEG